MKKYILTLCVFSLLILNSCGDKSAVSVNDSSDSTGKACLAPSERNPNGASELALLMRVMEKQTETWKSEIEGAEATLSPVSEEFSTLKSAAVTDPEMKNENFDGFADDFLNYSKALVESTPENRKKTFNSLVSGCMTCHNQMCPGPIKRINKFYIK